MGQNHRTKSLCSQHKRARIRGHAGDASPGLGDSGSGRMLRTLQHGSSPGNQRTDPLSASSEVTQYSVVVSLFQSLCDENRGVGWTGGGRGGGTFYATPVPLWLYSDEFCSVLAIAVGDRWCQDYRFFGVERPRQEKIALGLCVGSPELARNLANE